MTLTNEQWVRALDWGFSNLSSPVEVECINDGGYNYLNEGNIYIVDDFVIEEDILYLSIFVVDEEGETIVRRYNCRYFQPAFVYPLVYSGDKKTCGLCNEQFYTRQYYNPEYYYSPFISSEAIKMHICDKCRKTNNIHSCDICGIFKPNMDIGITKPSICSECLSKNYILIKCKCCGKKRIIHKSSKVKLCDKCATVSMDILEPLFNKRKYHNKKLHKMGINGLSIEDINNLVCTEFVNKYKQIDLLLNKLNSKDRTFGLEFEVEAKLSRLHAIKNIKRELDKIIIDKNITLGDLLIAKYDGSLGRNGIEFNTVILSGEKSLEYIKQILEVIKKYCYVDDRCGLHLHIGANDYTKEDLSKLYFFYQRFQKLFKLYVDEKRFSNRYCLRLPPKKKYELLNGNYYVRDRYRAVNFKAIDEFGTIELRILEGTLDFEKIKEWIELHIKILNSVKKDNSILLKDWKMPTKLKHILGTKLYSKLKLKQKEYKDKKSNPDLSKVMNFLFREE